MSHLWPVCSSNSSLLSSHQVRTDGECFHMASGLGPRQRVKRWILILKLEPLASARSCNLNTNTIYYSLILGKYDISKDFQYPTTTTLLEKPTHYLIRTNYSWCCTFHVAVVSSKTIFPVQNAAYTRIEFILFLCIPTCFFQASLNYYTIICCTNEQWECSHLICQTVIPLLLKQRNYDYYFQPRHLDKLN